MPYRDILTQLMQAHVLNISLRTVKYCRANVMSKLGLRTPAELVRYVSAHGLLAPPNSKQTLDPKRRDPFRDP